MTPTPITRAITELTQLQRRLAAVPVPREIREAIGAILIGLRSGAAPHVEKE